MSALIYITSAEAPATIADLTSKTETESNNLLGLLLAGSEPQCALLGT